MAKDVDASPHAHAAATTLPSSSTLARGSCSCDEVTCYCHFSRLATPHTPPHVRVLLCCICRESDGAPNGRPSPGASHDLHRARRFRRRRDGQGPTHGPTHARRHTGQRAPLAPTTARATFHSTVPYRINTAPSMPTRRRTGVRVEAGRKRLSMELARGSRPS